jgi:hypothetical protein
MLRILSLIFVLLFSVGAYAQGVPDSSTSGSISATNGTVTIPTNGRSTVGVSITGTWSGALTIKTSVDYSSAGAASATFGVSTGVSLTNGTISSAISANGLFQINASGFSAVQIYGTNIASGTVNVAMVASNAVSTVMADNPFPVTQSGSWGVSALPNGATAITGNATGTTGAVVGTLAGTSGKTTYICGFNVSALGTLAVGPITIAGLITSSMVYQLTATSGGSSVGNTFSPCIPASASNTSITITTTADASASAVDVNSWGFQQ